MYTSFYLIRKQNISVGSKRRQQPLKSMTFNAETNLVIENAYQTGTVTC